MFNMRALNGATVSVIASNKKLAMTTNSRNADG